MAVISGSCAFLFAPAVECPDEEEEDQDQEEEQEEVVVYEGGAGEVVGYFGWV